jgi:hypothetical protein
MRNGGAERERERGAELVKRICIKMRAIVSDYSFGLIYISRVAKWRAVFFILIFFSNSPPTTFKAVPWVGVLYKKRKEMGGGSIHK